MGMTVSEKILTAHSARDSVSAGEIVDASVDRAMVHEMLGLTGGVAEVFSKLEVEKVWDPDRIVALLDHWVPPPTVEIAETHKVCRSFVRKYGIKHWYDMNAGICHQVMPEKGHVCPGELIVGTDSHTTTYGAFGAFATGVGNTDMAVVFATGKLWFRVPETILINISGAIPRMVMGKDIILRVLGEIGAEGANYKAVEYRGEAINKLSIDGRMTVSNMSMEAGAKTAIIPADEKTVSYVRSRTSRPFKVIDADSDAEYIDKLSLDVSELEPQVAKPPSPANVVSIREVEGTPIDMAFIGSCTNGRLEDLKAAAELLRGRRVSSSVRLIVIPASYEVQMEALKEGLIEIFLKAGGIVESPTCGPCIGGHLGVLAAGEVAVTTTNRNFSGRVGSSKASVYLASPATVAASSIRGKISDPREV